jgi:hypothetical protein
VFSYHPFDSVARYRVSHLFGYRNSQPALGQGVFHDTGQKITGLYPFPMSGQPYKFGSFPEPLGFGKPVSAQGVCVLFLLKKSGCAQYFLSFVAGGPMPK